MTIGDMTAATVAASTKRAATALAPPALPVKNRYAPLTTAAASDAAPPSEADITTSTRRPPAIQVYGIMNIRAFAIDLGNAIQSKNLTVERLGPTAAKTTEEGTPCGDTCRLSLKTEEEHSRAQAFLTTNSFAYST